jgi:hypothetical protein
MRRDGVAFRPRMARRYVLMGTGHASHLSRRELGGSAVDPMEASFFRSFDAVNDAFIARRKTGVSRRPMRAPPSAVEDHLQRQNFGSSCFLEVDGLACVGEGSTPISCPPNPCPRNPGFPSGSTGGNSLRLPRSDLSNGGPPACSGACP